MQKSIHYTKGCKEIWTKFKSYQVAGCEKLIFDYQIYTFNKVSLHMFLFFDFFCLFLKLDTKSKIQMDKYILENSTQNYEMVK